MTHAGRVFVAEDAEDHGGLRGGKFLLQRDAQGFGAIGIVRAIEQDGLAGGGLDAMHAAGPIDGGEAGAQGGIGDRDLRGQRADDGNNKGGVEALVRAVQREIDRVERRDVSLIWPLTSLGFVITAIAAKFIRHEDITALRWGGVALIVAGAMLVAWSEKQKKDAPAAEVASTTAVTQ